MVRIMGLDYGDKNIGVAISDPLGIIAQGKEVIRRRTIEADIKRLRELVQSFGVLEIVVGLPFNMDGSLGDRGEKTLSFVKLLEEELKLKVTTYDERLSTVEAEGTLISANMRRNRRRSLIDKVAAVIILQNYLDRRKNRERGVSHD